MVNGFFQFCGNVSFWDEDLLLNSSWPEFTHCFQETALVWVPCGFLWIVSPFYLIYLRHQDVSFPWIVTCLNFAKVFLSLTLSLLSLMSILNAASHGKNGEVSSAQYVGEGITAATFVFAGWLVYMERRRGLVTSAVLFLFWLLIVISDVIPFYSIIILKYYDNSLFEFSIFTAHYVMVLCIFLLQFFAETGLKENVSPELTASFPSRLTFWWSQRMLTIGFRKSLESKDLYPLDVDNRSEYLVPLFQRHWKREKDRVHNIQANICQSKVIYINTTAYIPPVENTPLTICQYQNGNRKYDASAPVKASGTEIDRNEAAVLKGENSREEVSRASQLTAANKEKTIQATNGNYQQAEVDINVRKSGLNGRGGQGDVTPGKRARWRGRLREDLGRVRSNKNVQVRNVGSVQPSLLRALACAFWAPFLLSQVFILLHTLLQFVNPLILSELLNFVRNREKRQPWEGYVLACSFFFSSFLATCLYHQGFHISMPLGMRIKSAMISAVYDKALVMNQDAKRRSTVGEMVNLMSVDCQRVQDVIAFIFILWSAPLTVALALYQLWGILGPSSLAGLGVLLLVIPLNGVIVNKQRLLQRTTMRVKDQRLKLMMEVLNGIKVLKLYAWETAFEKQLLAFRDKELRYLQQIAYLNSGTLFIWTLVPYLVTLASFTAFILTSELGYLDSRIAFVSLSLFNIIRTPINMIPMVIPNVIQANVSLKRVNAFLNWADLDPDNVIHDTSADFVISIENGTFAWDKSIPRPTLTNINLTIPEGRLVAIVGPVGSGKSSLLAAMLGEMDKLNGKVTIKNQVAYVPQEAWILNATVKDNILFGKSMSQNYYDQVVQACALESDFKILVSGDMTEIGEKGINLSGGQKQRVSLARAVYSDADTYLLDDPLSAVDSHVGKHIFQFVIAKQGLLAAKTRILVTHGIHWLPMTDLIVVMSDGAISEVGTYDQLLDRGGAFATFLRTYLIADSGSDEDETDDEDEDPEIQQMKARMLQRLESISMTGVSSGDEKSLKGSVNRSFRRGSKRRSRKSRASDRSAKPPPTPKTASRLVVEEQSMKGSVKLAVYFLYLKALGTVSWFSITGLFVLYQASSVAANIWLSEWTDDRILANISLAGTPLYKDLNAKYLGVYGGLGVLQAGFIFFYALLSNTRMVRAAGQLHAAMLSTVLKCPMAFFDTTPLGRIINRFSRDVDVLDTNLPLTVRATMNSAGTLISTLILISYGSPLFLSVVLPLGALYKLVQTFYINASRQMKRLESTTRSPVYTHFTETIQGATSIRAYRAAGRFSLESQHRVDKNHVCYYAFIVAQRWLGIRLESIGSLITLAAALFAVGNEHLSSGLVGLSVTYAMNVTTALNLVVRMSSELETNIVSAERIKEYSEIETEAPWRRLDQTLPDAWPDEGKVEFNDFQMRYRPGLDLVLRGISCSIHSREKIGIVGRTGAGKSSLSMALFRLTEAAGGSIVIDGKTVTDLGLHDLRERLTILPQDPVVFSGTLRMNLDPTGRHTDNDLWKAIDLSHLHNFVLDLAGQLDFKCGEGGQNLSVGQRQLICLARALLRKSKILVLDEATAAVDMETDDVIQQAIRSEFKESTVLTIAHRLNTIMDYDRIMVMEDGRIKEFASPRELLEDSNSAFYGMAKASGLV